MLTALLCCALQLLSVSATLTQELIRHVYGFSIDSMHGDVSGIATQIQKAKEALLKMSGDRAARAVGVNGDLDAAAPETERAMRWEHIKARLKSGKYYRMVLQPECTAISFQCICMHPERRSYVQRICCIGRDAAWFSTFVRPGCAPCCVMLGKCSTFLSAEAWKDCIAVNICHACSSTNHTDTNTVVTQPLVLQNLQNLSFVPCDWG